MPFITLAERELLFEVPYEFAHSYTARRNWEKRQRLALGFPENSYREGLILSIAKKGKNFQWVLHQNRSDRYEVETGETGERAELEWRLRFLEAGLLAEGKAGSRAEAWTQACNAANSDRIDLGTAGEVSSLASARFKLKEFDRIANANPDSTEAAPKKYLFGHQRYRSDEYQYSEEYRAECKRFCYIRVPVTRETKLFLFVDVRDIEQVDKDGIVLERDSRVINCQKEIRRVGKGQFQAIEDRYDKLGSAWVGRGYSSDRFWLSLDDLVADDMATRQAYFAGAAFTDNTNGQDWTQILSIPVDEQGSIGPRELQRYYRRAAMKTHPDKGGTAEAFQAVQKAFEMGQRMLASV